MSAAAVDPLPYLLVDVYEGELYEWVAKEGREYAEEADSCPDVIPAAVVGS